MADWLRPFARNKTPTLATFPHVDRQSTSSIDESLEGDEAMSKLRPTSRVSSFSPFVGKYRPSTPPTAAPDVFSNIRDPQSTYHKPSTDQMAETLQVVMMTRSSFDSIPAEYNACILHVLEAYYDLRQQLNTQQETIEEMKKTHTKDIKDFEALAERWSTMEQDYKAEIKNLEIYLSKTENGMETVSLARSKSRVHGSQKASEEIGSGLSTIKRRHREENPDNEADYYSKIPALEPPANPERVRSRIQTPNLTESNLGKLEVHADNQSIGFFDSSTSDSTSSTHPGNGGASNSDVPIGLGLAIDPRDKPLPSTPRHRPVEKARESDRSRLMQPERLSSSYKPGDDRNPLAKSRDTRDHNRHRKHTVRDQSPEAPSSIHTSDTQRRPKVRLPDPNSRMSNTPSPLPYRAANDPLRRGDSTSSIVTAVRDHSGRNSVLGSQHGSRQGKPQLNRQASSTEAVTAAARALAASSGSNGSRTPVQQRSEFFQSSSEMASESTLGSREGMVNGKGKSAAAVVVEATSSVCSSSNEAQIQGKNKRMATF